MTFDVHPGVGMVQRWVAALPEKTGRSLEQWSELYRKLANVAFATRDVVARVKTVYGLGTVTANQIYEYTFGQQTWDGDETVYLKHAQEYVDGQFAGAKAAFRPLFEAVVDYARTLGDDVRVCPCKTMVPLYRNRVFAEMRPATKTRFELALCLVDVPFDGVLVKNPRAKGNDRQTHLVNMASVKDFTSSVKKWLKEAYRQDAGKQASSLFRG